MRMFVCGLGAALVVSSVVVCQVAIESLDRTGTLTWTNSVSNATYRVEWASSPTGAWQDFSALTNLLSLHVTTHVVTAKVPMLYRIVWTDPPPLDPVGRWQYSAYNPNGTTLCSTGLMTLWWTNLPGVPNKMISGKWEFKSMPEATVYHPAGQGKLLSQGGYAGGSELHLVTIGVADSTLYLNGLLSWGTFRGDWRWSGLGGGGDAGAFTARRIPGAE